MKSYENLFTPDPFLLSFVFISCTKDKPVDSTVVITLLPPKPDSTIILESPLYLSVANKGAVTILNAKGEVVQNKNLDGSAFCFRRWNINGQIRYTYIVNDVNAYHIPPVDPGTGYVVIADSSLNEIRRLHLLPYKDIIPAEDKPDLDVHDFILLSDNHYIAMAYYPKAVNNIPQNLNSVANKTVIAAVIQEVDNGQVIWQWESTDYPEFYSNSVEGNNFSDPSIAQDYMHMNSMVVDPVDKNLIVSFRNQDQIVKIQRRTGNILWRLGGKDSDFPLTSDQVFLRQHDATLTDNNQTLLLFDDGEINIRPQSRILEFHLDEAAKSVTSFKLFDIPEPFTQYMGSVQKIGSRYFIGGGTADYVLEVNYVTGKKLIELKGQDAIYRAYLYVVQ